MDNNLKLLDEYINEIDKLENEVCKKLKKAFIDPENDEGMKTVHKMLAETIKNDIIDRIDNELIKKKLKNNVDGELKIKEALKIIDDVSNEKAWVIIKKASTSMMELEIEKTNN